MDAEYRAVLEAYNRGDVSLRTAARETGVSRSQLCREAQRIRRAPTAAERRAAALLPIDANSAPAD